MNQDDQADALKGLFAARGGGDGSEGPSPEGAESPLQDPAGGAAGSGAAIDLLAGFLQQIQASQAGSGYAASGAAGPAQASAPLFDFKS